MAKYIGLYEEKLTYLDTCIIDFDNHVIRVVHSTTFLALHRNLADTFDEPEWMFEIAPTLRFTDTHGELRVPWQIEGRHNIIGTLDVLT